MVEFFEEDKFPHKLGTCIQAVFPLQVNPMMVAKYKCECGYKWKSKNSSGGPKSCNMCYKDVQPYKYRPAKEKVRTLYS